MTSEVEPEEEEEEKKVEEAPRKYMTAADFDRVCSKLNSISRSYEKSAGRYEAAMDKVVKTIEICQTTKNKIERK